MISAGEVGAVFEIKDDASAALQRLAGEFDKLQVVIDKIKESIASIGGADSGLGKLQEQLGLTGRAGLDASQVITDAFGRVDGAVDTAIQRVNALKASFAEAAEAARAVTIMPGSGGPHSRMGGGGGAAGTAESTAADDFHFRSAGVSVPGAGHATPSGDAMWPAAAILGGGWLVDKTLNQGGDLVTQQKLLRDRLGMRGTDTNVNDATNAAIQYARGGTDGIIGTTPAENLKGINELLSVTPDLDSAIKMYPTMMRGAKDLEELSGGKTKADESMRTLAKALENMGGGIDPKTHELSPERMQTAMNEAVKTIVAGGGFINDATLFGLAKQSGGMGRMTDPGHFFDETITSLIDVGGQRTGTALSSLGRQFLGDKMTKQTATELEGLGILPHGSWKSGGGSGIIMNPGFDIKGADEIKSGDLPGFFNDVIAPAIRAKVGDDNAGVMQESYKLFGQATGQRLGLMYLQNEAQRKRDVALKNGVDPDKVYAGIGDKDYGANVGNLGTAVQGLAQVAGSNSIPTAIAALHAVTEIIHGLTDFAAKGPAQSNMLFGLGFGPAMLASGLEEAKKVAGNVQIGPFQPGNILMQHSGASLGPVFGPSPLTPGNSGPHGVVGPPPVTVQPTLTVTTLPVSITVDNGGMLGAVTKLVDARITAALGGLMGMFKSGAGNSAASHDGRAAPSTPDSSIIGAH